MSARDVSSIVDISPERFDAVIEAKLTGAWLRCRAFGKRAIAQGRGGKVVLVSSARGKLGHAAGYCAYCASKAASDGLPKALGYESGQYGISVNAIAPTVFRSPLMAWMFEDAEKARAVREGFLARVPPGSLGEPEDLAGPLLFCWPAPRPSLPVTPFMRTAAIAPDRTRWRHCGGSKRPRTSSISVRTASKPITRLASATVASATSGGQPPRRTASTVAPAIAANGNENDQKPAEKGTAVQ